MARRIRQTRPALVESGQHAINTLADPYPKAAKHRVKFEVAPNSVAYRAAFGRGRLQ